MKIGKEVEGKFLGKQTLFCQANELPTILANWKTAKKKFNLEQLYVSDPTGELTEEDHLTLNKLDALVTIELTRFPPFRRLPNVCYMMTLLVDPRPLGFFSSKRQLGDQFKLTSDMYVAAASFLEFTLTRPDQFSDDLTINEQDLT